MFATSLFISLALASVTQSIASPIPNQHCTLTYKVTKVRNHWFYGPRTYLVVPPTVLGTFNVFTEASALRDVRSRLVDCQRSGSQELAGMSTHGCSEFPGTENTGLVRTAAAYEISHDQISRLLQNANRFNTTPSVGFIEAYERPTTILTSLDATTPASYSWDLRRSYTSEGERLWPNFEDERNDVEIAALFAHPARATLTVNCR